MQSCHINNKDWKQVNPQDSPVVYDVFHALYLYFLAVKDGQLEPLLDFIIEGKYDEKFVKTVNPHFTYDTYDHNLYLYWLLQSQEIK